MLWHERQTVAMELAAALHHSRGVGPSPRAATDAATQTYAAPAPVDEYIAPAPAVHLAPAPAVCSASTSERTCGSRTVFEPRVPTDRPGRGSSSGADHGENRRVSGYPVWPRYPNFHEFGHYSCSPCVFLRILLMWQRLGQISLPHQNLQWM